MFRLISLTVLLASAGIASAHFVQLVQVDNTTGGLDSLYPDFDSQGWNTYDIVLTVDDGDDWTSASMVLTLHGGVFFQHSLGGNSDPNPAIVSIYPALGFDSFFDSPTDILDGSGPGGFADGPTWTDTAVEAVWFDVDDTGGGAFTLFRFTTNATSVYAEGDMTYANTGGMLFHWVIWPTPGTAAPLLLAGMLTGRRRPLVGEP
jgi:hypothetical protein